MRHAFARLLAILSITSTIATASEAHAAQPEPTGEVLLTISGDIDKSNGDGGARFDRAMLEALPAVTFRTSTIWTEGVSEFTGVSLHDLMSAVGVTEGKLAATAINDYAVEIPLSDATENGPIVAYEMNGAPMSVRSKGPLWIVYPFDSNPKYQTEVIYSRSIWQLDRIVVSR